MRKRIYILLSLLPFFSFGQNKINDSLEQVLLLNQLDTNRVDALNALAHRYKYNKKERALLLSDEAEQLAKKLAYRKGLAATYYTRAYVLQIAGDYPKAVDLAHQSIRIAKTENDLNRQAYCHGLLGIIYGRWTNHEKAIRHNLQASDLFKTLGDTMTLAAINTNIGTLYEERGVYDSALVFYFQSLEYKRAKGRFGATVVELANIGAAYNMLGEHQLALDYNWQGIQQSMKSQRRPLLDHFYANRGQVFLALEKFDSAAYYAQAAYEKAAGGKQPYYLLPTLKLLGEVNRATGKTELAARYFQEGFDIAKDIGNADFQTSVGCELGALYLDEGRWNEAVKVLERAYRTGEEQRNYVHLECTSGQLAKAYEQSGNHEQALLFLKKRQTYQDSLASIEKSKHLIELERQYLTERQAKELAEKDLAIAEKDARFRNLGIASLIATLLAFGLFQYFRYQTKLKRQAAALQLELEKNKAQHLAELDRTKSNFFANISHEFRTPLTLILAPLQKALGEAQTFQVSETWKDEVSIPARHLSMMQRNAEHLQNLIDQLLDLSKLESGNMQLQVAEGDVVPFLRAMVFSFESLAERQQIIYETDLPNEPAVAFFDKNKLDKILGNLLSNAFKFTPTGGLISIKAFLKKNQLHVSIADSGPGIPKEELGKIFERFYQTGSGKDQGTGIGLSLVKELVRLHRGEIKVESEIAKGTIFHLVLPIGREAFKAKEVTSRREEKETTERSVNLMASKHVELTPRSSPAYASNLIATSHSLPLLLIVEDNPDLRQFIAETMQTEYNILTAENGEIGMGIAIEKTPDLIISDVMMPEMDGFEMCEKLKTDEHTSHIPIILLTARAGQQHKVAGLETGADAYLTKPFDEKELRVRARNLVEQRRQLRERFSDGRQLQVAFHLTPGEVAVTSADERFLKKVTIAIEENMDNESFSVEDLASTVAFSRSQLHRKLKALIGKSPNELIREFRLTRAKELLEKKAGNVSEVAMEVGYSSVSYFTRSFKQAFGVLPSEV